MPHDLVLARRSLVTRRDTLISAGRAPHAQHGWWIAISLSGATSAMRPSSTFRGRETRKSSVFRADLRRAAQSARTLQDHEAGHRCAVYQRSMVHNALPPRGGGVRRLIQTLLCLLALNLSGSEVPADLTGPIAEGALLLRGNPKWAHSSMVLRGGCGNSNSVAPEAGAKTGSPSSARKELFKRARAKLNDKSQATTHIKTIMKKPNDAGIARRRVPRAPAEPAPR